MSRKVTKKDKEALIRYTIDTLKVARNQAHKNPISVTVSKKMYLEKINRENLNETELWEFIRKELERELYPYPEDRPVFIVRPELAGLIAAVTEIPPEKRVASEVQAIIMRSLAKTKGIKLDRDFRFMNTKIADELIEWLRTTVVTYGGKGK
jgi:hypothetical protein